MLGKLIKINLIFLFLWVTQSFALPFMKQQVYSGFYVIKKGDTLQSILGRKLGIPSNFLRGKASIVKNIKQYNPRVENWSNLRPGTRIYLEFPSNIPLMSKVPKRHVASERPPEKVEEKKEEKQEQKKEEKRAEERVAKKIKRQKPVTKDRFSLYAFYAASMGTFEDKLPAYDFSAESTQNSPYTLGLGGSYKLNKGSSLSSSAYLSKLTMAEAPSINQSTSVPWEWGANLYYNHSSFIPGSQIYGGVDYEKFSTYNVDELLYSFNLKMKTHTILFATLGYSQLFKMGAANFLLKGSFSQSLSSSSSEGSLVSEDTYSGNKYILFLNYLHSKKVSFNVFFKQHILEGPTSLTITRFGGGLGYNLF